MENVDAALHTYSRAVEHKLGTSGSPKHSEIFTHLDLNRTSKVEPIAAAQMVMKLL